MKRKKIKNRMMAIAGTRTSSTFMIAVLGQQRLFSKSDPDKGILCKEHESAYITYNSNTAFRSCTQY